MWFIPFGCVSCTLNFHSAGTRCCLCLLVRAVTIARQTKSRWRRGATSTQQWHNMPTEETARSGCSHGWKTELGKTSYFWQSWLKRSLGLSGPLPGSFMFRRKRNIAAVKGSGLGSVTVSGLWNIKNTKLKLLLITNIAVGIWSVAKNKEQNVPGWPRRGDRSSACTLSPWLPGSGQWACASETGSKGQKKSYYSLNPFNDERKFVHKEFFLLFSDWNWK